MQKIKQYAMFYLNVGIGALYLFVAFGHRIDGDLFEWLMWSAAFFGITFGLLDKKLDTEFVKHLGLQRLKINLIILSIVMVIYFLRGFWQWMT